MLESKCKFPHIQLTKINRVFFFLVGMNKSSVSLDMSKNSASVAAFGLAFLIQWQFQMYLKNL